MFESTEENSKCGYQPVAWPDSLFISHQPSKGSGICTHSPSLTDTVRAVMER